MSSTTDVTVVSAPAAKQIFLCGSCKLRHFEDMFSRNRLDERRKICIKCQNRNMVRIFPRCEIHNEKSKYQCKFCKRIKVAELKAQKFALTNECKSN